MEKRIKRRIGALVVVGMFVAMLYLPGVISQDGETVLGVDGSYRINIDNDGDEDDQIFSVSHDDNDAELFRIQENGNVGIGTTSPTTARLDVADNTNALRLRAGDNSDMYGDNQIIFSWCGGTKFSHAIKTRHHSLQDGDNAIDFYVWDYDKEAPPEHAYDIGDKHIMTLDGAGDGRVGIGTMSPDEELHVVGNIKMVDGNQGAGKVLTSDANGVGTWQEPQIGIGGSGTTNYIPKFTDPTTLGNSIIYESPSGNIGIGTTNPANLLDVYEANPAPGADAVVSIRSADSNAYLKFSKGGATYSSWLQFDDPGQEGRWMMGQLGGTYDFVIYSSAVNPFLKLDYDTGNVGIGTTSPTGRLDVNGNDIRIRQSQTPPSSSADGYTGEIAWDQNAIYVCTNGDGPGGGTDTWKRASISIW